MGLVSNKCAAATVVAAAFSLLAAPVAAVELPRAASPEAYDSDALDAERHRRWRRGNDIHAGDVIAGVILLGTIAAVAGAARDSRARYPSRWPDAGEDWRYRRQADDRRFESRGIDRAVDMCVGEVERGSGRVETVDSATRTGQGWRVSGALEGGAAYSCTIGNDGRISEVEVGGYAAGYDPAEDPQWDDEDYFRAREALGEPPPLPESYPGDDRRYETARAPDFE